MFPDSSHIFLCPSMMTGYWRKKLGKLADSMFILKSGSDVWPKSMYESLTIAFVKPLLTILLGKLDFYQRWKDGLTQCKQCNGKVKEISGVICGNFGHEQIPGYQCSEVYHAKCYRQHKDNRFPVL